MNSCPIRSVLILKYNSLVRLVIKLIIGILTDSMCRNTSTYQTLKKLLTVHYHLRHDEIILVMETIFHHLNHDDVDNNDARCNRNKNAACRNENLVSTISV